MSRQTFAVLLEALGLHWRNCSVIAAPTRIMTTKCNIKNNVTLRMLNDNYGESWYTNTSTIVESDIIVMNFGVWYVEQKQLGRKTNHTSGTYLAKMRELVDFMETVRKPHQLIVFRESAEMLRPTSATLNKLGKELQSLWISHRVPMIAHQSAVHANRARPKTNSSTVADLFHDWIHHCEPTLQLAWLTVLSYIVRDWKAQPR